MKIKNVIYNGADSVVFVCSDAESYTKDLDSLDSTEKAFFMCFFVAEGLSLLKIRRDYPWALSLSQFFLMLNEERGLYEFYEKAKNARLHALEERLFSESGEDKTEIIKTLSLLRPKDKKTHVVYEITPWVADKDDI